jgi:hypothetical protein
MKYKKEMKLKGVEVDTTPPPPQTRHCASPSHVRKTTTKFPANLHYVYPPSSGLRQILSAKKV